MKKNEKIEYKMTNEEAISYLKWARPINPYSLDKKKVQMAIDMAIEALEQELRDCKTCKHSNNGNCAYTEECHECMWENKYEQEPILDKIRAEIEAKCCITVGRENDPAITLYDVFEIIDKYKAESEDKE